DSGWRHKTVYLSDRGRPLHPRSYGRKRIRELYSKMHALVMCCVLFTSKRPAGMPVPPGLLFNQGRFGSTGASDSTITACGSGNARRAVGRSRNERLGAMRASSELPPQNRGLTAIA